jgi:UDP-N-acetyl-D-mannosaminuronic acid dehydrogenase
VLTTDPYVKHDPELSPLDEVVAESDLLIVGTPHERYREITTDKPVVDIWNVLERGVQV